MAGITVAAEALHDIRFRRLARFLGLADSDHARGKLEHAWWLCLDRQTYTLPPGLVAEVMGFDDVDRVVKALIDAELAELTPEGLRLRGTEGRIEWLGLLRRKSRKGGDANRARWLAQGHSRTASQKDSPSTSTSTSTSTDPPLPPRGGRIRRGEVSGSAAEATDLVVGRFNKLFERNLSPAGFRSVVQRALTAGFTAEQMVGAVWWAKREWGEDEEMRAKLTPTTLLKLRSSQGYRTLHEYVACAAERWRQEHDGQAPPWERPKLAIVPAPATAKEPA